MFKLMVQAEVENAVRIRYPVSLVTVLVEPPASEAIHLTREAISLLVRRSDVISLVQVVAALHLLLPDALLPEAERVIERIRASLRASSVTLKFGAACFPTTAQTGAELLEQADQRAAQPGAES